MGIGNLKYLEKAYPDLTFTRRYDKVMQDWLITVKIPDTPGDKGGKGHSEEFYWANGSMLPESEKMPINTGRFFTATRKNCPTLQILQKKNVNA